MRKGLDMEPMDVDKSFNSSHSNIEEISFIQCNSLRQIDIDHNIVENAINLQKNYRIATPLRAQSRCSSSIVNDKRLVFSVVFVVLISFLFMKVMVHCFKECTAPSINIQNLKLTLGQNLHGQDEAIEAILHSFSEDVNFHVTLFVGPMGTGKTFTSNLIAAAFEDKANIIRMASHFYEDQLMVNACMESLSKCIYNIIIIDDLVVEDVDVPLMLPILQWKAFLSNLKLHVILIYRGNNISDIQNVLFKHLLYKNTPLHVVNFSELDDHILNECIKNALDARGLKQGKNFDEITVNYNVRTSGCKTIYNKISLLL